MSDPDATVASVILQVTEQEPTEAEVEAAARALTDPHDLDIMRSMSDAYQRVARGYAVKARAALLAAKGAGS